MGFRTSGRKMGNVHSGGYHSKREHRRAQELELQQKIGAISELKMQVKFELIPKQDGERAIHWIADFTYCEDGTFIVEDCKGYRSEVYRIKRKLFQHRYGIKIRET